RTPIYITDRNRRLVTILAGRPKGNIEKDGSNNWDNIVQRVTDKLNRAGGEAKITQKWQQENRRGDFKAIAVGVSFGQGQKMPGYLKVNPNQKLVHALITNADLKKCSGFAAKALQLHNKKAYSLYKKTLNYVCKTQDLKPNFTISPWAACTFNLGSRAVTKPHLDCANLSYGWCAVTAFGNFNPDTGGHMMLWDLGIYIRFPPGSTILLPSALLVHSNSGVGEHETRCSMTQYSASSLFRWSYNKGRNDKKFAATATQEELEKREQDKLTRWEKGLGCFPKVG
ncbi:hypothetical protein CPB84DRAFT_1689174, partial [Gymnopilus junonius]